MIQFIQITDEFFLNLGLIVEAAVLDNDGDDPDYPPDVYEKCLQLTTTHGTTLTYYGDDAANVTQRLNLLGQETQSAVIRMQSVLDAAEQQFKGVTAK